MTERFTVYDVFAVLVPGAVFNFLVVVTMHYLANIKIVDWSGGFGDATVLLITGYATGVFLQALGNAVTRTTFWERRCSTPARFVLLLPASEHYQGGLKDELLVALQERYGVLPAAEDARYAAQLRQHTYRAYKETSSIDPMVSRFLAEHHQMRAYMVAFFLLSLLAVLTIFIHPAHSWLMHLGVAAAYWVLSWLSVCQLKSKDEALAWHVHAKFLELTRRKKHLSGNKKALR